MQTQEDYQERDRKRWAIINRIAFFSLAGLTLYFGISIYLDSMYRHPQSYKIGLQHTTNDAVYVEYDVKLNVGPLVEELREDYMFDEWSKEIYDQRLLDIKLALNMRMSYYFREISADSLFENQAAVLNYLNGYLEGYMNSSTIIQHRLTFEPRYLEKIQLKAEIEAELAEAKYKLERAKQNLITLRTEAIVNGVKSNDTDFLTRDSLALKELTYRATQFKVINNAMALVAMPTLVFPDSTRQSIIEIIRNAN